MSKVIIDGPGEYLRDDKHKCYVGYFHDGCWYGHDHMGMPRFWTPDGKCAYAQYESLVGVSMPWMNITSKATVTHAMAGGEFLEQLRFVMCVALTDAATATVSIRVYPARDEGVVYDLRTWTVESVRIEEDGLEDERPTDLEPWDAMVDRLMTHTRINKVINETRGT